MSPADAWADALTAISLFAADPVGLGGIAVRAAAGPVRDRWLALLQQALPPGGALRRVPLHMGDDRLLGGLDLAATLQAGRPIAQQGLLAEADGGVALLAMAERLEPGTVARLCGVMDRGAVSLLRDGLALHFPARFGVIALDEGVGPDETVPPALLDRLAFHVDLTGIGMGDAGIGLTLPLPLWAGSGGWGANGNRSAAERPPPLHPLPQGEGEQAAATAVLCGTAMTLGVGSVRAPLLALRAARAAAALDGRTDLAESDLTLAARLVLAPRATCLPPSDEAVPEPDNVPAHLSDETPANDAPPAEPAQPDRPLMDVVLSATRAALPPNLLASLAGTAARLNGRTPGRVGQVQNSLRRGRPIGTRQGELRSGARLHIPDTLKAAAPWQKLRQLSNLAGQQQLPHRVPPPAGPQQPLDRLPADTAGIPSVPLIAVRRDDFRIVRFRQRTQTATVFAVDASGSTALHRLAEAKGAVELLLADCYVRRDQVALIAFRGRGAELLLPPTGSLLRAKRCLAGLPGGGATPLAAGIDAAVALADGLRRRGRSPIVTLLTDGRANMTRDGTGGRQQCEAEALASARLLRVAGLTTLFVDTSPRPNPFARRLAEEMRAHYVPLPYADGTALSRAVRSATAA
jgi:magnesium chelatase subunit D